MFGVPHPGTGLLGWSILCPLLALGFFQTPVGAASYSPLVIQDQERASGRGEEKETGLILEPERVVEFTTDEGTWMSLDVSPDGQTLVFDLLGDLYLLSMAGGEARAIATGMAWDGQPRFSPDGTKLAFVSDRDGNDNIWVMDADGSNPRQITKDKGHNHGSPTWSPDGQYILARRWGPYPEESYLRKVELWMFHVAGGKGVQVTTGEGETTIALSPAFSPDGRYVYFSSHPDRFQYNVDIGRFQVRRLDRETGRIETLTDRYGGGLRPLISPNGRYMTYGSRHDAQTGLRLRDRRTGNEEWLAFPITRDDQEGFAVEDLLPGYAFTPESRAVVTTIDGKPQRIDLATRKATVIPFTAPVRQELAAPVYVEGQVADGPVDVRYLRWIHQTPDGRRVVFSGVGKLWAAPLPEGEPRRLTDRDEREYAPAVSPDGRWVAYVSWSDREGGHLWKVPAGGGRPVRLTTVPGYYANPAWSPDGRRIAFVRGHAEMWMGDDRETEATELRWIGAEGGPSHLITTGIGWTQAPVFSGDGERVYYLELDPSEPSREFSEYLLVSVELDGGDRQEHARISGFSVETVPSPDGRWLLFTHQGNAYLAPMPRVAGEPVPVLPRGEKPEKQGFPVWRLGDEGGQYLAWADGGQTITWGFTDRFYRLLLEHALARSPEGVEDEEEETEGGQDGQSQPELFRIRLSVPRDIPRGTVAFEGARLVTMRGEEAIERGTIVVTDNRIAAVGPVEEVALPPGARVIDVSGYTIIPGLVDLHAHLGGPPDVFLDRVWEFAVNLAYGVTSSRDPSNSSAQVFPYAEMIEAGEILGPRLTSSGWAMTRRAATSTSYEKVLEHARRYKAQGAVVLKEYMQPRRIQRQWYAKAAREVGINLTAEGGGELKMNMTLILDGYTGFEHSLPQVPIYRDVVELLARSGSWYTPTLLVSYGGFFGQYYFRQKTDIHADEKLRRFTPHEVVDREARRRHLLLEEEYHFPGIAAGAAEVLKAGGRIGLGAHGEQQGLGAHWELWALQMGGLSNYEALRAATLMGAAGLGYAADLGSLEPGKLADLVVLTENPLEDIRNTLSIRYVMRNGELFEGETLDQVWPEERPFGPFFWQREDEDLESLRGAP